MASVEEECRKIVQQAVKEVVQLERLTSELRTPSKYAKLLTNHAGITDSRYDIHASLENV